MKKRVSIFMLLFCATILVSGIFVTKRTQAASKINNLKTGKEYYFDLNKNGAKESLSYELVSDGEETGYYKIWLNGKMVINEKITADPYSPQMQVTDIDKKDGVLDIWAYSWGCSDDIVFSALYQYRSGKLKKVFELTTQKIADNYELEPGYLNSANGKGKFSVVMDRALSADSLIGNHLDVVPFQLKNKKVSRVSTSTFAIKQVYNTKNRLKAAQKLTFTKEPKTSSKKAFTLSKGQYAYVIKIKRSGDKLFVQFKNSRGIKGWLAVSKSSWEKPLFSDRILAD